MYISSTDDDFKTHLTREFTHVREKCNTEFFDKVKEGKKIGPVDKVTTVSRLLS
jgi:hypothetical protein